MTYQGHLRFATVLLLLALSALACTFQLVDPSASGGSSPAVASGSQGELPTPVSDALIAQADAEELLLVNLYQRVSPAVVNIDVSAQIAEGEISEFGQGSGFIVDPEGYIVTNNHVVSQADEIRVVLNDGTILPAEVVGTDEYADIAVVKVDPPADRPLVAVEMGDSNSVQVGQRVIAIGNPFGYSGTMTVGIVSAVGRTLPTVRNGTGTFSNPLIIQTDAAINPGNSGGPLLDSHGQVIGVNVAIRSESGVNSGIGFAIPINTVKRAVPQIIENGAVQYPYLGIQTQDAFSMAELAAEFDLPVSEGVLVSEVTPGGSAARAGIRGSSNSETYRGVPVALGGDIITAIDGVAIRDFDELLGYLVSNTTVGQEITVTVIRDGETMQIPVTLAARPNPGSE